MKPITNLNNGTYKPDAPIPSHSEQEELKIARRKINDPSTPPDELPKHQAVCEEIFTKYYDWCQALSEREKGTICRN